MKTVLNRLILSVFLNSLLLSMVSCWRRDRFPAELDIQARVLQEPEQKQVTKEAFRVDQGEVPFLIEPLYSYDLTG